MSSVYALSLHADYRCRHSGACCGTDWDVPVELPVYRSLTDMVERGVLVPASDTGGSPPFIVEPDLPEDAAAIFRRTEAGACVFLDPHSHLCVVHRDAGEAALPTTCRCFPRLALRDPRGTSITLSHFCPTAASMLFRDDVSVAIVESPPAFPMADYDGLATGPEDLPPLLHPGMLMDAEGYAAWERHMVARCAEDASPESVLATLVRDARALREWRPGGVSLAETVRGLSPEIVEAPVPQALDDSLAMHAEVMTAVPEEFLPEPDEDGLDEAYKAWVLSSWAAFRRPLNRYLAAKAFACWTAYQGRGVLSIVRGLEAALALVRVDASRQCRDAKRPLDPDLLLEAFRGADFVLNHLAVGEDLAAAWSRAEEPVKRG